MNNIQKRFILFLFLCIPLRLFIAYLIYKREHVDLLKFILLFIGFGFTYIYALDLRKTGGEVFGSKIWWNNLRPLHALNYLLATYMLHKNIKRPEYVILFDTIVGFLKFLIYHIKTDNIDQLL